MVRRASSYKRSSREWGVRAVLALGAAWLGYGAISHTIADRMARRSPEKAYGYAPDNARVKAKLSSFLSGPEGTAADRTQADKLAIDALRHDPTAVEAVAALGVNAQIRGDAKSAQRLFHYSQSLSRRDLTTQLWMIESAVTKGNIPKAIHHYDIAMRTSRSAPDLLWPVLASALSEPEIRVELARTLARGPVWSDNFIPYIALRAPDTLATADLLARLRRARVPVAADAVVAVISRLIVDRHYDAAWRFYSIGNPAAKRHVSRDARFSTNVATPSAFDWQTINDSGITSSIESRKNGGIFDFAAAPSVGGPILRQIQLMPPGAYQLEGHSAGIEQASGSLPYWTLTCGEGQELGRLTVPNSAQSDGKFAGNFVIPNGCPFQTLTLVARSSDRLAGTSGQIDYAILKPVR
jgi:hypothetical protein